LAKVETKVSQGTRRITAIEWVGLILLVASLVGLLFFPEHISGAFTAMFTKAYEIFSVYIFNGTVGIAIIVSVMTGRILERLGFTDALMRVFVPIMNRLGINSAVVIPGVYNILGDINAAGRIAGPILVKAGATKDEQKIAIATMVQSQQSFSTFMLGIAAMILVGVKVFPIIILVLFLPLILVPLLLRFTVYRDTKGVALESLPTFTPKTPALPTIFNSAKEGAELLFLLIIPAAAAVYAIIGGLDYLGIWKYINDGLTSALSWLSIHPETGILSIMVSPTLAMGTLREMLANGAAIAPKLVVGSFVLASSGLPLSVIFGQTPAIWAQVSDLNEKEALGAAVLGTIMRFITAAIVALLAHHPLGSLRKKARPQGRAFLFGPEQPGGDKLAHGDYIAAPAIPVHLHVGPGQGQIIALARGVDQAQAQAVPGQAHIQD
jgi:hypothetical protein